MKKVEKQEIEQVLYDGKWVDKNNFRTMLYKGMEPRLVMCVETAEQLKKTGEWSDHPVDALAPKVKKKQDVSKTPIVEQLHGADS